MHRYIARANIDHYLSVLSSADVSPQNRDTVTKLLIGEEDRLSHDLEQLQFAQDRAATGRDRVHHLRKLRDAFVDGSTDRAQADRLLTNAEAVHQIIEHFCHRMREKVHSRGL